MQRLVVILSDDEHETLRRLAYERHVPIAELVREAIDQVYGTAHGEIPKPGRKAKEHNA
jgi:hypothetical protein